MAGPIPAGFDESAVYAGLYAAMDFGAPSDVSAQATFYIFPTPVVDSTTDSAGVPFDPAVRPSRTPTVKQVPCAITYVDVSDQLRDFGVKQPSRIEITLLGPDYEAVKGFTYMTVGGQRFYYSKTAPPEALGDIDVWTVYANSEDES